jgi:hypothetical protein
VGVYQVCLYTEVTLADRPGRKRAAVDVGRKGRDQFSIFILFAVEVDHSVRQYGIRLANLHIRGWYGTYICTFEQDSHHLFQKFRHIPLAEPGPAQLSPAQLSPAQLNSTEPGRSYTPLKTAAALNINKHSRHRLFLFVKSRWEKPMDALIGASCFVKSSGRMTGYSLPCYCSAGASIRYVSNCS